MRLTLDEFWPLILLIIIPALWRIQRKTLSDISRKQLFLLTTFRSVVVLSLVLALMRPVIYRAAVRFSVAYVIDVSHSVSSSSFDAAMRWIDRTNTAKFPVQRQFIPFAANSAPVANIDELKKIAEFKGAQAGVIDRNATNI